MLQGLNIYATGSDDPAVIATFADGEIVEVFARPGFRADWINQDGSVGKRDAGDTAIGPPDDGPKMTDPRSDR